MALMEYKEGEHPGGFVGFRVVTTINGEYRQKYFSLNKKKGLRRSDVKRQAQSLEQQWSDEAKVFALERSVVGNHPNVDKLHATGFKGIRLVILCESKLRAGEMRRYYAPAIVIRSTNEKAFRISNNSYEKVWKEAVQFYVDNKEMPKGYKSKILKSIPDKSRFRKIRLAMIKKGHDIPLEVLKKRGL